jgi:recombination protein RecT
MQQDAVKFITTKLGEARAKQFAAQIALIARDNPKLAIAIQRNPESFLTAFMASADRDLMPNTSKGLAYLIPYGDKVQFQVGYQGLLLEARRTGEVMTIDAELVFEGDEFDVIFGTERKIVHRPKFDIDRTNYAKVTHVYATAKLTNGEHPFVVLSKLDFIQVSS